MGLFTLLLMMIYVASGLLFQSKIGELTPKSLVLNSDVNNTLVLKCTLTGYSNPQYNSSNIYFAGVYDNNLKIINPKYYVIKSEREIDLVVPNVQRGDGSTYKCTMNDSTLGTVIDIMSVKMGSTPSPKVTFMTIGQRMLIISWCKDSLDPAYFTLKWSAPELSKSGHKNKTGYVCSYIICNNPNDLNELETCQGKCRYENTIVDYIWKNHSSKYICDCWDRQQYYSCKDNEQGFRASTVYNVELTSSHILYGKKSASYKIKTLPRIDKPDPARNLTWSYQNATAIKISCKPVQKYKMLYRFSVLPSDGRAQSASTIIPELIFVHKNNTEYTITVKCKPRRGEHWSGESRLNFRT